MGHSLPIPGIAVCDVITVCLLAGEDQAFAFGRRVWCEEGLGMNSLLLVGAQLPVNVSTVLDEFLYASQH